MRGSSIRVWVTRTEPGASRLAELLAVKGFEVFKAPVLRIEPLPCRVPPGDFDFALFVSEHAVRHAFANGWQPSAKAAAIGQAAHRVLRRHGVQPCLPWQSSVGDVIAALPKPPAQALIVKGEGGSDELQRWLRAQGGTVAEWNVYRRIRTEVALADERIDAIVVASGAGLDAVGEHWLDAKRDLGVPLFVPSQRLKGLALESGFASVFVTRGANAETVAAHLLAPGAVALSIFRDKSRLRASGRSGRADA